MRARIVGVVLSAACLAASVAAGQTRASVYTIVIESGVDPTHRQRLEPAPAASLTLPIVDTQWTCVLAPETTMPGPAVPRVTSRTLECSSPGASGSIRLVAACLGGGRSLRRFGHQSQAVTLTDQPGAAGTRVVFACHAGS